MRHPDPDSLAVRAMGEPVLSRADEEHVAACPACAAELASMQRTVAAVRPDDLGPQLHPDDVQIDMDDTSAALPPAHVWQAVEAELGLRRMWQPERIPTDTRPAAGHAGTPGPARAAHVPKRHLSPAGAATAVTGPGRSRRRRRGTGVLTLALTAVVAAVLGSAVTAGVLSAVRADPGPTATTAAAALAPVDGAPTGTGTGVAAVVVDHGEPALQVDLSDLPASPGFHGVWLIDVETGQMVPLGVLPGQAGPAQGVFAVPPGLDLAAYDLVDVSDEPLDGDPAHSGVSLVRGTLTA